MKQYEYRILEIAFSGKTPRDEQILTILNQEGRSGWRMSSLEVEPRLAINEDKIKVLLERELG